MQRIALITLGLAAGIGLIAFAALRWRPLKADKPSLPAAAGPEKTGSAPPPRQHDASSTHANPSMAVTSPVLLRRDQQHDSALDPSRDGWRSEAVAATIQANLDRLGKAVTGDTADAAAALAWISDQFQGTPLRPELEPRYEQPPICVLGPVADSAKPSTTSVVGRDGFRVALRDMVGDGDLRRFSSKVVSVELEGQSVATTHLVETYLERSGADVEQHATWDCRWQLTPSGPTLTSLACQAFEEVVDKGGTGRWFSDQTEETCAASNAFANQLSRGLNYWLRRIESVHGMYVFAENGLAVGDVNGDGLEDLYICQPGGLPNRMLLQSPDGTVRDAPSESGVDWLDHTSSALLLDADNDGDQDLFLAIENRLVLGLRNDGTGRFSQAVALPLADRHVQSLSAADYDRDGDVDLYCTLGFADERARPGEPRPEFVYHDANEGGANILFRNELASDGGATVEWKFTDVTRETGLDQHNRRHSLAAAWADYDDDGDQDIYVANDYGKNCLYRNDEGHFTDVAEAAGVVDFGSGMSADWADYDRDGYIDLYVGNMFSTAGSRITSQAAFLPDAGAEQRRIYARFAKGNTLFRNQGDGQFADVGAAADVQHARWAWSSVFADINNDGWEDAFVANGYVTGDDNDDL